MASTNPHLPSYVLHLLGKGGLAKSLCAFQTARWQFEVNIMVE